MSSQERGRKGKLRKKVALIVVGAALATALMPASPAHAASYVKACFKWWTGSNYASQPVVLQLKKSTGWVNERRGSTNSYGCAAFSYVPTGYPSRIKAYKVVGDSNIGLAIFEGLPQYYALAGSGGVNLGTGVVRLTTCTWGLYDYCAGWA